MEIDKKDLIKIMAAIIVSGIQIPDEKDAKIAIKQAIYIFNDVEKNCSFNEEAKP